MGWTITIGRVTGTEIKVHLTFFILVAFWAMAGYRQGGPPGALLATLSLLALFACVVLHEFGHILMAARFGVRTPDVILLPIGGVARLERTYISASLSENGTYHAVLGDATDRSVVLACGDLERVQFSAAEHRAGNDLGLHG